MKLSKVLAATFMGLALLPLAAHAQACTASGSVIRLSQAQIGTLLAGKLVCGRPGASYPGVGGQNSPDRWQEEHMGAIGATSGDLWDYKLGPGHPIDPRKQVGTWVLGGDRTGGAVTHAYGPTTAFTWSVYGPAANTPGTTVYSFCTAGAEHVRAYVITSAAGCGGTYPP